MFTNQREKRTGPHIVALVELDMQKKRVRIVFAREAISERLRELEHPGAVTGNGMAPSAPGKLWTQK